ncbi:MAG: sensor histidine kinase [Treponema sp.]|nr:sensor histidine kinase [Treponema sp.]
MNTKTLTFRITILSVTSSLLLALLITIFSSIWYKSYIRQNTIHATEFNLQFIQSISEQQISSILQLIRWCNTSSQLTDYLDSDYSDNNTTPTKQALEIYDRVLEQVQNCPASYYICRFVITDLHGKIIQTGTHTQQSIPLNATVLQKLLTFADQKVQCNMLIPDPLSFDSGEYVIPIMQPITNVYSKKIIGYVYISISADLFIDSLKNYHQDKDTSFYLSLDNAIYQLQDSTIKQSYIDFDHAHTIRAKTINSHTKTGYVYMGKHKQLFVSYPFSSFPINYTQVLSQKQNTQQTIFFMQVITSIVIALALFAFVLRRLFTLIITVRVHRLQERLQAISDGDFSLDNTIEWEDELGSIGKGINTMANSIQNLLSIKIANEKQRQELEYKMLQSQINPHFLYNTLNSIRWMATIQNAPGIAEMVTALASLLKNISNTTAQEISLHEELNLLDDYFVIQKYRYGGSISLSVTFEDKSLRDCQIPRFTLQPIIENAIFHGIEPKGTAGEITITIKSCNNGDTQIDVKDNGIGMSEATIANVLSDQNTNKGSLFRHIGLANVHKRLQYAFGTTYGLSIVSKEQEYTIITVRIPGPSGRGTK